MRDVVFTALVIAFFAVAILFVRACDAVVGPSSGLEGEQDR